MDPWGLLLGLHWFNTRSTSTRTLNRIKDVGKGDGVASIVAAIPVYRDVHEPKRAWHVLLDSGSDGDLIFIKADDVKSINPIERAHPLV